LNAGSVLCMNGDLRGNLKLGIGCRYLVLAARAWAHDPGHVGWYG
jgi:hypothetical protein